MIGGNLPTQREKPAKVSGKLPAALGAYEVGAIGYLYDHDMECAIVAGASSGAMNAVCLRTLTLFCL
jgi:hypothetical protein